MKIRLASPREFAAINREWLPWFVPTATRDRGGRRVHVFTIAGKFVNQVFNRRECHAPDCGNGQPRPASRSHQTPSSAICTWRIEARRRSSSSTARRSSSSIDLDRGAQERDNSVRCTSFQVGNENRLRGNFDIYNVFNENVILSENTGYGLQWLTPYETMGGRLFKFSTQFEF